MTPVIDELNQRLHDVYFEDYPAEAVRTLEQLSPEKITEIVKDKPAKRSIRIWERLSPGIAADVMSSMKAANAVRVLNRIDPGRGAAILSNMSESQKRDYLRQTEAAATLDLERAMSYPADSAGAVMGTRIIYYTPDMKVHQALSKLKAQRRPSVRALFLVNDEGVLQGMVEVQDLALAGRDASLRDLMVNIPAIVEANSSRPEMVEIFETHRMTELPVVDFAGRLLGIVRHHVLVNVAREESSVDIQTMVGVSKDERALSKASFAIKRRLPWLQVNLATAFLAAAVVGIFEQTIAQVTALAILLPVVAGQSGNTGAQALAVTMRGLALREVWPRQWRQLVFKELSVGFWNGLAVAATTALGVYVWSQSLGLCLIIAVSMVISMMIASVSGALIPILLTKAGQDPATSSSIFLTTVTDVMGFLSFLGIATLLIGIL